MEAKGRKQEDAENQEVKMPTQICRCMTPARAGNMAIKRSSVVGSVAEAQKLQIWLNGAMHIKMHIKIIRKMRRIQCIVIYPIVKVRK